MWIGKREGEKREKGVQSRWGEEMNDVILGHKVRGRVKEEGRGRGATKWPAKEGDRREEGACRNLYKTVACRLIVSNFLH